MLTANDTAWAAGLFEGEGCFHYSNAQGRNQVQAVLSMTDFDVVERFAAVVGVGSTRATHRVERGVSRKSQLRWQITSRENFQHVYNLFKPWLGTRRLEQGQQALDRQADETERRFALKTQRRIETGHRGPTPQYMRGK